MMGVAAYARRARAPLEAFVRDGAACSALSDQLLRQCR
jgi:hypothetical protein